MLRDHSFAIVIVVLAFAALGGTLYIATPARSTGRGDTRLSAARVGMVPRTEDADTKLPPPAAVDLRASRGVRRSEVPSCEPPRQSGVPPAAVDSLFRRPRKLRDVWPTYPQVPPGTVGDSGVWVAELRIDSLGNVAAVRVVRPIVFRPPVPGFDDAILTAIGQWTFEPALVGGVPVDFCLHVASIVHWWD
jgi:TonB family protein